MFNEIFGLILLFAWSLFLYGYVMRNNKIDKKCNIVYYPDSGLNIDDSLRESLRPDEEIDINQTMSKIFDRKIFIHNETEKAPMGYSEIEMLLPRVNVRYDSTELNEYIF